MAKRLSKEEAIQRVIDKINLLKDAESADIEKYMNGYAALRDLEGQEREDAYNDIVFALFGDGKPEEDDTEDGIEEDTIEEMAEEIVEEVIEEAAQLPAVVEAVTAIEVVENETSEECRKDSEGFGNSEKFRISEAVEAAKVAAMMIAKVAMAVAGVVQIAAPVLAKLLVVLAGRLVDGYYAVTTYVPIGSRWVAIHLVWFIQDSIPVVAGAVRKAGAAAKVAGRGFVQTATALAGWVVVVALTTISLSVRTAEVVADGWRLREEIMAEQAA